MKLAVVVQRYGADISGGAELHARYVAEHLARHADIEVLTTCARDYVTWRNELPAGEESINGIPVRRFRVRSPRDPQRFGRWSDRVFEHRHSLDDELRWLESEGPASPALIRHLDVHRQTYDFFLFFSYRYYHAYHGCRAVAPRAVLVPTAERDPAVGVSLFGPIFRGVRALMYNSREERAMLQAVSANQDVPGVVVGVGSAIPERTDPARFRAKYDLPGRFVLYVGRIDRNKGCDELFAFFQHYLRQAASPLTLVLIGHSVLPIPAHPQIRHLGFLDDADKFDALAAADLLIMPSYYESLSMVTLEAWALGRPVLANAHCSVLRGQCGRSNGGLYYADYPEFAATLYALESDSRMRTALGENGRSFYRRHYAWPIVEGKYVDMLAQLADEDARAAGRPPRAMEPLPGWFARRAGTLSPAREVVDGLPWSEADSGLARAADAGTRRAEARA